MQGRFGEGLLQVLLCRNDGKCPAKPDRPFGESQCVRIVRPSGPARVEQAGVKSAHEPARTITGWTREADYPAEQLYYDLGFHDQYPVAYVLGWSVATALQAQFPALEGDKLSGWPNFITYPDVSCPKCDGQLQLVLQLARSGTFIVQYVGTGPWLGAPVSGTQKPVDPLHANRRSARVSFRKHSYANMFHRAARVSLSPWTDRPARGR